MSTQARDDKDAGLITLRTAVERIARFYGIEDIDTYLETLKGEQQERVGSLHSAMAALKEKEPVSESGSGEGSGHSAEAAE